MKVKLIRISDLTVVASNDYPVMVVTPREDEKASGRRLNNFVTELVFVRIADGGVEFTMPDDGWASVGFDKINRAAKVHLDDASDPIVQFRENEPMDAMRYLRRGTHRLMVSGSEEGGHLFVRAIRPMVVSPTCERPAFTDKANYQIGFDYYRRYLYHTFNTYSFFGYVPEPDRKHADDVQLHADMVDNGFRTICEVRIPEPSEKWATTDSIRGVVRSFAGWREGLGVLIDETSPYCPRQNNHSLAEFCWQDGMERQSVSLFWNSCLYAMCEDPRGQSSMLSGIANSGGGMGMILPETYLIAYPDRAQMFAQQQHFADFLASIRAQVPCATRSVMLCFSGYITSGGWNGYSAPDVDMKVVIDEFVRNLAINPAFADLGGIAFYAIGCHEEMFRWYMDTIRHYAILGKTDSRAEEFGYRLHPGHIVNNDFSDDGRSWRIDAAEHGSIVPWYRKDYGRFVQARKMVPSGYGDTAMLMTRSKVAPNKISQIMTKLEPGRLYLASCCTVDVDDLDNPGPGGNDMTFRILVDNGASEIPGLAITHRSPWNRQPDGRDRWSRMPTPLIVTHSTVFRADSTTARLTLTDWGKDDDPVGRIGQRRAMNYVIVRPYYEEKPIGVIDVEQEDK